MASERTEKVKDYLVFKTNQATDDHLGENSTAVVNEVTIKRRGSTKYGVRTVTFDGIC